MSSETRPPTSPRTHFVPLAAIVLGILGEFLFSPGLLGINLLIFTAALGLAVVALSRALDLPLRGEGRWLLPLALLFAGFVAWRSSPVLQAINVGTVVVLLSLASFRLREGRIRLGGVTEFLWLALLSLGSSLVGFVLVVWRGFAWGRVGSSAVGSRLAPWLRAALIAVPLVAVFARLLASADVLFSNALTGLVVLDFGSVVPHAFRSFVWTWVAAGFLRGTLLSGPGAAPPSVEPPHIVRLGPVEVSTILGLLDVLFLAFVAFQVRYLFGGSDHVQVTSGLTYAEYARQGFFELLAVAALVLPLVLGVHWLLRDSSPVLRTAFRILSAALIVLLYVVIASALQRMRIYVDEFGLTRLRLYATASILWLAVVFAWLALTVLRERRNRFAFGALTAGLLVVATLNALDPDAVIVDTNLDRAEKLGFDAAYALSLSPDATPTLVAALPRLPAADRCRIARELAADPPDDQGWRAWNYSREQARDLAGTLARAAEDCD